MPDIPDPTLTPDPTLIPPLRPYVPDVCMWEVARRRALLAISPKAVRALLLDVR